MTFLELEDAPADESISDYSGKTIKCSWCGEIIQLNGNELALAMCQACYDQMLAEFLKVQHKNQTARNSSDR